MGTCFLYGNCGGGSNLNFKVVGGTTQPENPKENTIWVNTDTEITSWSFSATEPGSPVEGMVWISTGTSSTVEFNALKKNGIHVYPLSEKQYVGGAWVNVGVKSYRKGEWVSWWDGILYNAGNEYDYITGGWDGINLIKGPTALSVAVLESTNYRGVAWTNNSVDLSKYKTVNCIASAELDEYKAVALMIATDQTANNSNDGVIAKINPGTSTITNQTLTLEIPSGLPSGEYYVKIFTWKTTLAVSKIWLE